MAEESYVTPPSKIAISVVYIDTCIRVNFPLDSAHNTKHRYLVNHPHPPFVLDHKLWGYQILNSSKLSLPYAHRLELFNEMEYIHNMTYMAMPRYQDPSLVIITIYAQSIWFPPRSREDF